MGKGPGVKEQMESQALGRVWATGWRQRVGGDRHWVLLGRKEEDIVEGEDSTPLQFCPIPRPGRSQV